MSHTASAAAVRERFGAEHGAVDPTASHVDLRALPDLQVGTVAAFLAVVDTGSFTAAAKHLHLSQPGLSGRVARLEQTLRVRLLDRSSRAVALTSEGRAFLPVARALVELLGAPRPVPQPAAVLQRTA